MRRSRCSSNSCRRLDKKTITVRVNVIGRFLEASVEKLATSWFFVVGAGGIPIRERVRIDEIVANDVLNGGFEESVIPEVDDPISNK